MGGGGEREVLHRPSPSPLFGHPASTHVFGRADRRPPCGRMIFKWGSFPCDGIRRARPGGILPHMVRPHNERAAWAQERAELPDRIAAYQRDLDATPISAMLARPPNRPREPVAPGATGRPVFRPKGMSRPLEAD